MASKAVNRLSVRLSNLPAVRGSAPWPDHEYVKGWGVFGLPFDAGHVLALRVFPEPLPARGVLATGQATWEILDPAEYEHTRSQTAAAAQPSTCAD